MTGSINKHTIVGYLGADPETISAKDGKTAVRLSIGTTKSWNDKTTQERKQRTTWHRVVVWNEHYAKIAKDFFRKGSLVHVEGEVETTKYTDSQGIVRYPTQTVVSQFVGELQLIGPKKAGEAEPEAPPVGEAPSGQGWDDAPLEEPVV